MSEITILGWICSGLAMALVVCLFIILALYNRKQLHKAEHIAELKVSLERLEALVTKEKRITELKADLKLHKSALDMEVAMRKKIENELKGYIEQSAQVQKDNEDLKRRMQAYKEDNEYKHGYIQAQLRTAELKEKELADLEAELKRLREETPEYLRSLLLTYINENKNLKALNTLLENANQAYSKDLEECWQRIDEMKGLAFQALGDIKATKPSPDAELDYIEQRPEPEYCESEASQCPAPQMAEDTAVPACF